MTEFLKIKNWEQFQHYKHRDPPWIKLHRQIFQSEDWVSLADASKLLAIVCMVIGARNNGMVPNNPAYIKRVAYLDRTPNLKPLIECGFLEKTLAIASALQANACPETETEIDKKEKHTKRKKVDDSKFEEFWKIYPSRKPHVNPKKPAKEKFNRLVRDGMDPEKIIKGAEGYADAMGESQTEPRFIKTATVFLNQHCWEEYIPEPLTPDQKTFLDEYRARKNAEREELMRRRDKTLELAKQEREAEDRRLGLVAETPADDLEIPLALRRAAE